MHDLHEVVMIFQLAMFIINYKERLFNHMKSLFYGFKKNNYSSIFSTKKPAEIIGRFFC